MAAPPVRVGQGTLRLDLASDVLYRCLPDTGGTYTMPYLQTEPDLPVWVSPTVCPAEVTLFLAGERVARAWLSLDQPETVFEGLGPGEYTIRIHAAQRRWSFGRIGLGTVVAALGDSIIEGYRGAGFQRPSALHAGLFPPSAVSQDGRNFPQHSPTTPVHWPGVNCLQGFLPRLNDLLTAGWRHPVFIANEGWGGYTTAHYVELMRTDPLWAYRMRLLRPTWWLVHLGINDERAGISAGTFEAHLEALVEHLLESCGASPKRILIAKPCYDQWPGAERVLGDYQTRIELLTTAYGLRRGPDFYRGFGHDPERWYGVDPVHPNEAGMDRMADLWAEALLGDDG